MPPRPLRLRPLDAFWLLGFVAVVVFVILRVRDGFEYKSNWSAIPQFMFRHDPESGWWVPNYLVQGLLTTLKLSFWALIPATALGVVIALFRTSQSLLLRLVGRTFVELVRNVPPLVLIFLFYFFFLGLVLPLIGFDTLVRQLPREVLVVTEVLFAEQSRLVQFVSGVVTLAFFEAAYIAEILRGGIESIERSQKEASYSLGLSRIDELRFIILPQAFRRQLPALTNEYINTVKYSSIASVVSIQELTFMGRQAVAASRQLFEVWITVALLYLILTLSLSLVARRFERSWRGSN
jgi:polar amino acid transport system permease protein